MTQAYNLSQLANFVNTSGQLNATTGLYNTSSLGFPSGTRMSFNQTSAPTGWTKDTSGTIDDSILRFVTGSVSSGGSVAFSTWNSAGTTGDTTLSTPQIPSHTHTVNGQGAGSRVPQAGPGNTATPAAGNTGATGGDQSHTHPFSFSSGSASFTGTAIDLAVQYVDVIIATKD